MKFAKTFNGLYNLDVLFLIYNTLLYNIINHSNS